MDYPKGYHHPLGFVQIAVRMSPELFKAIIKMAKAEQPQKNFNAMIVSLIECGKLDLEESDRLEPRDLQ